MAGPAIGRGVVFGTGEESIYGTAVAIDRRELILNETLGLQKNVQQPPVLGGGLHAVRRGAARLEMTRGGSGNVVMVPSTTGLGRWLEHMIGGTPTIVQQEATTAYLQTHTSGALTGKSLTVQKVLRSADGSVIDALTMKGCKVMSWGLTVSADSFPQLTVTLDAQNVVTDISEAALVALPAPSPSYFSFKDAALTVNGAAVARVLSAEVNADNALDVSSHFLGGSGLKAEPEPNDYRTIGGTLQAQLLNTTLYDLYDADTGVALVLTFTRGVIEGAYSQELKFTIPQVHLTGDTPQVSGAGVIETPAPFEASYNDVDDPLTVTYQSTDTTI